MLEVYLQFLSANSASLWAAVLLGLSVSLFEPDHLTKSGG